jgi:hypothetical protein|tara:strand:- start:436 stop:735 length:300 start_codon:yes stop_codon:yes gene_type:complete
MAVEVGPNKLSFKNRYTIYENEIVCTVDANDFNMSQNPTITTDSSGSLRNFATSSNFMPYVTTVGLYNDNNELLLVGKLAQPMVMSGITDTTYVIRYDQ